jgi:hypothetical protein
VTEAERKQLLELCHKIINAEDSDPNITIGLVHELNELLEDRNKRLKGKPPAST